MGELPLEPPPEFKTLQPCNIVKFSSAAPELVASYGLEIFFFFQKGPWAGPSVSFPQSTALQTGHENDLNMDFLGWIWWNEAAPLKPESEAGWVGSVPRVAARINHLEEVGLNSRFGWNLIASSVFSVADAAHVQLFPLIHEAALQTVQPPPSHPVIPSPLQSANQSAPHHLKQEQASRESPYSLCPSQLLNRSLCSHLAIREADVGDNWYLQCQSLQKYRHMQEASWSLLGPNRAIFGNWSHETAHRAAKWPYTGKPKLSRVTSGCGGLMIPLSRNCLTPKNWGYMGVA